MSEPAPQPSHHRLLLILLPVAGLHALALGILPPWLKPASEAPAGSVAVELASATTPKTSSPTPSSPVPSRADAASGGQPRQAPPPARPPAPPTAAQSPPPPAGSPAHRALTDEPPPTVAETASRASDSDREAPPPKVDDGWQAGYLRRLRTALEQHKHYPAMARRFGEEGEAVLAFDIERDGRVSGARLLRGSGSERLDQAALQALRQLARFEPLPSQYPQERLAISVPLVYRLE